jgi:hypothetical protein
VWAFWLFVTRNSHPSFALALIVTTSLVSAYAAAAYLNHVVLIPRFLRCGMPFRYLARLAAFMFVLTGVALAVIRLSYFSLWGPDADPNGLYKHFAIDLFGMAVHLVAAAAVVGVVRFALSRNRAQTTDLSTR